MASRDVQTRYMTVTLDLQPEGINVACWISTVEFWLSERKKYPYDYQYLGEHCAWLIHGNMELTPKLIVAVGETADRICRQTEVVNSKRKIANL